MLFFPLFLFDFQLAFEGFGRLAFKLFPQRAALAFDIRSNAGPLGFKRAPRLHALEL